MEINKFVKRHSLEDGIVSLNQPQERWPMKFILQAEEKDILQIVFKIKEFNTKDRAILHAPLF